MMPKVAIFFSVLLLSSTLTNSHVFGTDGFDMSDTSIVYNSDLIDIDQNFLIENNFKRYLIFGSNLESSITV